jgi:UDP-glucuronate decarboxylase
MRILVTGGAGFIGSHLCKKLVKKGHTVICVDNLLTGNKRNIEELIEKRNFNFLLHDVIEPLKLKNIDQIYHLACAASPKQYIKDPIHTAKTTTIGTMNMLELAKENNARILLSSTSEVYGDPLVHPQKEDYWGNVNPIGQRSCYDEGKRCAESLCMDYHRVFNLDIRIVRIFNTYGPSMDPEDGRAVSNFVVQALKNENITIQGDGTQTRSFQYIDDLLKALVKMMNNEKNFIGPVNLGNPEEFTIRELSTLVLSLIPNSKSKVIYLPLPEDDPMRRRPDITLAREMLDWEPKIKLKEGLKPTIKYFSGIMEEKSLNKDFKFFGKPKLDFLS